MKKFIFILCALLAIVGCKPKKPVVEPVELVVENVVSTDREKVFLDNGEYKWYETCVVYDNFFDADTTHTVASVSNIFQILIGDEKSFDTYVFFYNHTPISNTVEKVHSFWVEDFPLNNEEIKITFAEALQKMYEANIPKPHSRNVVLRKEIGPLNANPQYIFGNSQAQVYVDAVTGEVRGYNPAFPENAQLNYAFSW